MTDPSPDAVYSKETDELIEACKLAYHSDYEIGWRQVFVLVKKKQSELLDTARTKIGRIPISCGSNFGTGIDRKLVLEAIDSLKEEVKIW